MGWDQVLGEAGEQMLVSAQVVGEDQRDAAAGQGGQGQEGVRFSASSQRELLLFQPDGKPDDQS